MASRKFHNGNGYNYAVISSAKETIVRRYYTNGSQNSYDKLDAWQPGKHEIYSREDAKRFYSAYLNAKNWVGAPWQK